MKFDFMEKMSLVGRIFQHAKKVELSISYES